jgi:hypothetical protein
MMMVVMMDDDDGGWDGYAIKGIGSNSGSGSLDGYVFLGFFF